MDATAILRFTRVSPRKARLVADAVRGKRVEEALNILEFMDNKPSGVIMKVLRSAIANAGNKEGMDTESLFISRVTVDEGPMWKRYMPRSMGRAYEIQKKMSHINVTLSDGFKAKKGAKKKVIVPVMPIKKSAAKKEKKVRKPAKEAAKKEAKTETADK
jgi:large subunit ribosomal protein L22